MIFFLLFVLSILLFCMYKYSAKYVLSPVIIVAAMFGISTFVCAANYSDWGDISGTTVFVIVVAVFSFFVGHIISDKIAVSSRMYNSHGDSFHYIAIWKTILVILFMLLVTYFDYREVSILAGGQGGNIFTIVAKARQNLYIDNASFKHNGILLQGLYISRMLAYLFVFYNLYSLKISGERIKVINIVPIFVYLIQALLSTGRTELFYLVYTILLMNYCLTKKQDYWVPRNDFKYTRQIIVAGIIFSIVFLFLANIRSTTNFNPFKTFSVYAGSSVYALDKYISEYGLLAKSSYFGEETMSLYYSVLNVLGLSNHKAVAVLEPIYFSNSHVTNIYTALRRYLHDYGLPGMTGIMLLLGFIYSRAFKSIRKNMDQGLRLITYSFLSYPLIEFSIEERFLSNLITARTVYCLLYLFVFYRILFHKTVINR